MINTSTILQKLARKRKTASESKKIPVYIKLDEDVLTWFKSEGRGYQKRINSLLAEYIQEMKRFQASRFEHAQAIYEKYYTQCFWHMRRDLRITENEIPLIMEGLKKYGGREGYKEAQTLCQ